MHFFHKPVQGFYPFFREAAVAPILDSDLVHVADQAVIQKIRFQVRGRDLLQLGANVLLVVVAGVAIFQAVFLQVAGYTVFNLLLLTLRGRIDAPICQIVQIIKRLMSL